MDDGDRGDATPRRRGHPGRHRPASGSAVLTPPTGLPATPEVSRVAPRRPAVVRPVPPPVADPCVCHHAREAHEHWRHGSDCGTCGPYGCSRYRRPGGPVRRLLRRLHLVP